MGPWLAFEGSALADPTEARRQGGGGNPTKPHVCVFPPRSITSPTLPNKSPPQTSDTEFNHAKARCTRTCMRRKATEGPRRQGLTLTPTLNPAGPRRRGPGRQDTTGGGRRPRARHPTLTRSPDGSCTTRGTLRLARRATERDRDGEVWRKPGSGPRAPGAAVSSHI